MHTLPNILIELIFVILHFLVFVLNYGIMKRKMMQPAVLFSFLWFGILFAHFIFSFTILDELPPLHTSTFIILFIGVIAFSFGSFLQTIIWQKNESALKIKQQLLSANIHISLLLRYILIIIILIAMPFYIQAAYRLYLASNIDNFFIGLQTELVYGDEKIGPLKYTGSLSFVVFALNLCAFYKERNKINSIFLTVSLLFTIIYAVLSTSRTFFLMIFSIYVGVSFLQNKNFSIKKISRLIAIFMVLFIAIGWIYGKGGSTESSVKENLQPAAEVTSIYIVSPLNALDYDLNNQFEINYKGTYTFRFFNKVFEQLGLISNPIIPGLFQPFVLIPYPTNVYTLYDKYIKDFGKFYAWAMVFLFGFIHTYLYNKAVFTKNLKYTVYYSVMLFPLLISFFDDLYLSGTSVWLQIIFYIELLAYINVYLEPEYKRYVRISSTV